MPLNLVNPQPEYGPAPLLDPPPTGYMHVAAVVEPPSGRAPRPGQSVRKTALLAEMKARAEQLERLDTVQKATIYRAIVVPPARGYAQQHAARVARFDVAALIETTSVDALDDVQRADPCQQLLGAVTRVASDQIVMPARCIRYVGPVDKNRQGLFLFNYFVAGDPEVALQLWEHLAGWYMAETELDNSTLLSPLGAADYVFVNHARWEDALPRFVVKQFAKKSFRTYVLANLQANDVGAMPILYRLA